MSTPRIQPDPVRSRNGERRLQRAPLIAAAFRSRVGDRSPEYAAPHGDSSGVPVPSWHHTGRAIPSAGAGDRERLSPADGPRPFPEDTTMSTRVVLARARRVGALSGGPSLDGPPEVHAYRVSVDELSAVSGDLSAATDAPGEPGSMWVAVCGNKLSRGEAEIVERYAGAPCMSCMMAAIMASDVAPLSRADVETPPALPPAPPGVELDPASPEPSALPATPTPMYAASWRERVVHIVEPGAPVKEVDGRTLVMGACGGIGWPCNKPKTWEVCPECKAATS